MLFRAKTSEEKRHPIGVLVDLAGPKIRLGEIAGGAMECEIGQEFHFMRGEHSHESHKLTCNYTLLIVEVAVGHILIRVGREVSEAHLARIFRAARASG